MRARCLWMLVALISGALFAQGAAGADGGVHKGLSLRASFAFGDSALGHGELVCEIAPVLYRVTTFEGSYRVLQITVHNVGRSPLAMSKSGDGLTAVYRAAHEREVKAVLDLPAREPQLWSKLPLEVRTDLAYPTGVPPGEEETVFAFVPIDAPPTAPDLLRFSLGAVPGRTIELRAPATAKY